MVNVKAYNDGDRKILVIENCTGELARKVGQFMLDLYGVKVEPTPIPAVEPIKVSEDVTPNIANLKQTSVEELTQDIQIPRIDAYVIPNGAYQGLSIDHALTKGSIKAAIDLSLIAKHEDEPIKGEMIVKCKEYILGDLYLRNPEMATSDEIYAFIEDYKPLIKDGLKQILEMQGYADENIFLQFAEIFIQQEAYAALIEALKERVA